MKRTGCLLSRCLLHGALLFPLVLLDSSGEQASKSAPNAPIPRDGKSYIGYTFRWWDTRDRTYGDIRAFSTRYGEAIREELGNVRPTIFAVPAIWQNIEGQYLSFESSIAPVIAVFQDVDPNAIPVISWSAQTGWDDTAPEFRNGISAESVAAGAHDDYITEFAHDVRRYGRPIFIRAVCLEVNRNYAFDCSHSRDRQHAAQQFVLAWIHVVDLFRRAGATNVSWIWNVNTFPPSSAEWGIDSQIARYYPGDKYVDWITADHYDYGPVSWLDPILDFAASRRKPFGVVEWGIRHPASILTPSEQQAWIAEMFSYVSKHSSLKMLQYFNYNLGKTVFDPTTTYVWLDNQQVNYRPSVNDADHRLLAESGGKFRATFARGVTNDMRYQLSIRH